jgi:hypothetical protein
MRSRCHRNPIPKSPEGAKGRIVGWRNTYEMATGLRCDDPFVPSGLSNGERLLELASMFHGSRPWLHHFAALRLDGIVGALRLVGMVATLRLVGLRLVVWGSFDDFFFEYVP